VLLPMALLLTPPLAHSQLVVMAAGKTKPELTKRWLVLFCR